MLNVKLATRRQYKRFKNSILMFGFLTVMALMLTGAQAYTEQRGSYVFGGETYSNASYTEMGKGYVLEFTEDEEWCHSFTLLPGFPLFNRYFLSVFYLLVLFFLFLGIAIVADIFMAAIEVITSTTRTVTIIDEATGE